MSRRTHLARTSLLVGSLVLAQSGNTVSIYDERSGSDAASNCTLSGYLLTCSAAHYPLLGCSSMSASYSITLSSDASTLSGTATILCHDDMCTAPANVSGTRISTGS